MHCPAEIAEVILPILQYGLIRVRAFAWQGQAELCAVEADHIHNLPDLLADYTPQKLYYYWNAERPDYVRQVGVDQAVGWEELWQRLGDRIDHEHTVASHP
ncbi:MAG: hypothetical protein WBQ11_01990 [Isosphaeraceae bacterium]